MNSYLQGSGVIENPTGLRDLIDELAFYISKQIYQWKWTVYKHF